MFAFTDIKDVWVQKLFYMQTLCSDNQVEIPEEFKLRE